MLGSNAIGPVNNQSVGSKGSLPSPQPQQKKVKMTNSKIRNLFMDPPLTIVPVCDLSVKNNIAQWLISYKASMRIFHLLPGISNDVSYGNCCVRHTRYRRANIPRLSSKPGAFGKSHKNSGNYIDFFKKDKLKYKILNFEMLISALLNN